MHADARSFRFRSFITLILFLSGLVAGLSGVAMFLRPEGSLARWVGWTALGLDKKQWEAVHIAFVAVFVLASAVHVWYNWRTLVAYLKRRVSALRPSAGRRLPAMEVVAAVAVTLLIAWGTLAGWQPFSSMVALRTSMKDGAFLASPLPPLPEAEGLPVAELCRRLAISEQQAVEHAQNQGISIADTTMTIGAIAAEHHVSPAAVYEALRVE